MAALISSSYLASGAAIEPSSPLSQAALAQIIEHEDERYTDEALIGLLNSKETALKERVILALGRIGDQQAIAPLIKAFEEEAAASTRAMLAFALGEIESEAAVPSLLKRLQMDGEVLLVKSRCVEALGKIGANKQAAAILGHEKIQLLATTVAQQMEKLPLASVDSDQQLLLSLGLTSLQRLKQQNTIEAIARQLQSKNSSLRAEAANALTRSKLNYSTVCPALLECLRDQYAPLRVNSVRALGAARYSRAETQLLEHLGDSDTRVISACIVALGEIANPASSVSLIALGERLVLALSEKGQVSKTIPSEQNQLLLLATALGNIKDKQALPLLEKMRFVCSPYGRAPEIEIALAKFGDNVFFNEKQSWPQACDSNWQSLAAFAQGLAELKSAKAEEVLFSFANGKHDPRAVSDILNALAACKSQNSTSILIKHLDDSDVVVRATSAGILGDTGDSSEAVTSALHKAYLKARQDKMNDARLAIIESCEKLKHSMARDVLVGSLRDRDYVVRRRAFELLKESGADTKDVSPGHVDSVHSTQYWKQMARLSCSPNPFAVISCAKGIITMELFASAAPMTVNNFVSLANKGYFDKLTFMRVVPNFVIQGGDPRNDMNGGPGYQIRCEINTYRYETGSLGMALSGKDTGGSQFFLTHAGQAHLDGGYTCFGKVVEGMDVVNQIARGDVIEHVEIVRKPDLDAKD